VFDFRGVVGQFNNQSAPPRECNCLCLTSLLLAILECWGLFPGPYGALSQSDHIFLAYQGEQKEWYAFEPTSSNPGPRGAVCELPKRKDPYYAARPRLLLFPRDLVQSRLWDTVDVSLRPLSEADAAKVAAQLLTLATEEDWFESVLFQNPLREYLKITATTSKPVQKLLLSDWVAKLVETSFMKPSLPMTFSTIDYLLCWQFQAFQLVSNDNMYAFVKKMLQALPEFLDLTPTNNFKRKLDSFLNGLYDDRGRREVVEKLERELLLNTR
jgi:hypothetical protein